MPKKYSQKQKEEWLKKLQSGSSEKQLAIKNSCDVRTIKKGIQQVLDRQAAFQGIIEFHKEAVRKHMNMLLVVLSDRINSLSLPDLTTPVLSWHREPNSVLREPNNDNVEPKHKAKDEGRRKGVPLSETVLLDEHLRYDKSRGALKVHYQNQKAFTEASKALQLKTIDLIQEYTGLDVTDKSIGGEPVAYTYTAGRLLYQTAIVHRWTNETSQVSDDAKVESVEGEIEVDDAHAAVAYRRELLMEYLPEGNRELQRTNIIRALNALVRSEEAKRMVDTYRSLELSLVKARNTLEEIRLYGVVPGQCRICKRFHV